MELPLARQAAARRIQRGRRIRIRRIQPTTQIKSTFRVLQHHHHRQRTILLPPSPTVKGYFVQQQTLVPLDTEISSSRATNLDVPGRDGGGRGRR